MTSSGLEKLRKHLGMFVERTEVKIEQTGVVLLPEIQDEDGSQ